MSFTYKDNARALATSARSVGGGTLTVANGTLFGTPSAESPMKLGIYDTDGNLKTVLLAVGRSGNTLTLNGNLSGYTDEDVSVGDTVANVLFASDISTLQSDLAGKVNSTDITTLTTRVTTLETDSSSYLTDADLSSYALLTDLEGFVDASALAPYATVIALSGVTSRVTALENSDFLTSADLSGYANIASVNSLTARVETLEADTGDYLVSSDLAPYVLGTTLTSTLSDYITTGALSTQLSSYATLSALTTAVSGKQDLLPSQTGQSGKALTTNGSALSWGSFVVSADLASYATTSALTSGLATKEPTITAGTSSQYLRGDKTLGTFATDVLAALPSFTGNDGKYLSLASGSLVWSTVAAGGGGASIGGSVTGGTSGSILYVDASGNLAQANSGLFYDATNKRLGVGLASPSASLDAQANGTADLLRLRNTSGTTLSSFDVNGYGFIDVRTFKLAQGVDLTTGTNLTNGGHISGYAGSISKVKIQASTNGASGGFTLDIKKNGTSIFTTLPTVANSITMVQSFTPTTTAIAENDILTVDCTATGTAVQQVIIQVFMKVRNT